MSEPEQCIICLDPLPRPSPTNESAPEATSSATAAKAATDEASHLDIVSALDGCEHIIHDSCIRSWAQKTNTCPICRTSFHTVRVYNGLAGTLLSTYQVQDRKQVAEFDHQQWLAQNPDPEENEPSNPCPICNSSEREDILLLCDSCDAAYHTHCIGLDYVPQGEWYCMECIHLLELSDEPTVGSLSSRPQSLRRATLRDVRGYHVRTRARLRRVRRQARDAEWQGAWGQFAGRFFEISDLDLDNHDDDEDLEQYRRFQQHDLRELQRWQQRVNIAQRLGAREEFANNIPPQISDCLQPPSVEETRDERRAWGALERAREAETVNGGNGIRKRRNRSVTMSPSEPVAEPERKLKRPRTRRLPTQQGDAFTSASSPAAAGPSYIRQLGGMPMRNGPGHLESETPLVSSLLKELEPHAPSEDETPVLTMAWRFPPEASSPALSPSPSNHSSPRALSPTPPPLPRTNGQETSPTMSLSTHIEPRYPPANYSPNRPSSDHSDSETRTGRPDTRPLELRQPRPRRLRPVQIRIDKTSPTRSAMTHEEKKNINDIVRNALRPHWRARKLTTEQYESINRAISRKLYDEVNNASSLDDESRRSWEKRASQEVAHAVTELQT